jgi:hypothetical protein
VSNIYKWEYAGNESKSCSKIDSVPPNSTISLLENYTENHSAGSASSNESSVHLSKSLSDLPILFPVSRILPDWNRALRGNFFVSGNLPETMLYNTLIRRLQ